MCRILYSLIFVTVLLLAGSAGLASENEPSGGGTVPTNTVWLPVVGKSTPCEASEGGYVFPGGKYPPPPYYHSVSWKVAFHLPRVKEREIPGREILIAKDDSFQDIVASGGGWTGLGDYFRLLVLDEDNVLIGGEKYYARMSYDCSIFNGPPTGFFAQTPVLTFIAGSPPP